MDSKIYNYTEKLNVTIDGSEVSSVTIHNLHKFLEQYNASTMAVTKTTFVNSIDQFVKVFNDHPNLNIVKFNKNTINTAQNRLAKL